MLRAATAQQANIQRWLAPHLMCVKDAHQTLTHLWQAMRRSTALARLARRAKLEVLVHSVWRASTRLRQEMLRAATAQQANIQRWMATQLALLASKARTKTLQGLVCVMSVHLASS